LAVSVGAFQPDVSHDVEELVVAGTAAQRFPQARTMRSEETGVNHTVGRESGTGAIATERLGHRGDESNFTLAVDESVALRNLTTIVALERLEGPALGNPCGQVFRRHHDVLAPGVTVAHVHILDETYDDARTPESLDEVESRVVV